LNHPSRYTAKLGGPVTPWDNLIFATKGDVSLNAVHIVEVPGNAFRQTADVPVLTVPALTDALMQNPNVEQVGHFNIRQADTEIIRMRNVMYVPAKYAPLFLDSCGISPQVAWDAIMPLILQDDRLVDCQILVNWLNVSLTLLAPTANANNQQPASANLKPVLLGIAGNDDMTKHREIILARDLLGCFKQVGTEAAIIKLAQAVTNGNQET